MKGNDIIKTQKKKEKKKQKKIKKKKKSLSLQRPIDRKMQPTAKTLGLSSHESRHPARKTSAR